MHVVWEVREISICSVNIKYNFSCLIHLFSPVEEIVLSDRSKILKAENAPKIKQSRQKQNQGRSCRFY